MIGMLKLTMRGEERMYVTERGGTIFCAGVGGGVPCLTLVVSSDADDAEDLGRRWTNRGPNTCEVDIGIRFNEFADTSTRRSMISG
jgi:hypothetical protein